MDSAIIFPMRLQRFLSLAGVASRRDAENLIAAGRVAVNGAVVMTAGVKVQDGDRVECDGQAVTLGRRCYVILNKPRGYVCTADDPYADKKVLDLVDLPDIRLYTVGRLDKDSEGLLLLTNDGDYAARLTHPRYRICKTYVAKTDYPLAPPQLDWLRGGIVDDGELLCAESIDELAPGKYRFVLNEGKKREIRRMIAAAGAKTLELRRIAVGHLELGQLPSGRWRELTAEEVALTQLSGQDGVTGAKPD